MALDTKEPEKPTIPKTGTEVSGHPNVAAGKQKASSPDEVKDLEENFGSPSTEYPDGHPSKKINDKENGLYKSDGESSSSKAGGVAASALGPFAKAKSMLSNRKRIVIASLVTTILGVIAGAIIALFGILQGPFQFIHMAELLKQFHISRMDFFTGSRSAKAKLYYSTGQGERGRLGAVRNSYANVWERRLNQSGLRSVYQSSPPYKFVGYQVTDPDRARNFLRTMERDGIRTTTRSTSGVRHSGGGISGANMQFVDLSTEQRKRAKSVQRTAVRSTGKHKVSSFMGTRVLSIRGATNFRPFRNLTMRTQENYTAYRERNVDQKTREVESGRRDGPRSRRSQFLSQIRNFFGRYGSGALTVAMVGCTYNAFSDAVDDTIDENQEIFVRAGVDAVSRGSQVQAGHSINEQELGIYADQFYDEATETSWLNDPGVQHELGLEPTGTDYIGEARGVAGSGEGRIQPLRSVLNVVLGNFVISGACRGIEIVTAPIQPITEKFGEAILAGLLRAGLDVEQWIENAILWVAGGAVDAFAKGSAFGGTANVGAAMAMNDQFISTGAVELTDDEAQDFRDAARNEYTVMMLEDASLYDRYLNPAFTQSLVSQAYLRSVASGATINSTVAKIPTSFFSIISSMQNLLFRNTFAQNNYSYDYGFSFYGFPLSDIEDNRFSDPYINEQRLEDMLDATFDREQECAEARRAEGLPPYPECEFDYSSLYELNRGDSDFTPDDGNTDRSVGSDYVVNGIDCFGVELLDNGVIRMHGGVKKYNEIPDECREERKEVWLRYRFHIADMMNAHSEACFEGRASSCEQIGMPTNIASSTSPGSSAVSAIIDGYTFPLGVTKSQVQNRQMFEDGVTQNYGAHGTYTAYDIVVNPGTPTLSFTEGVVSNTSMVDVCGGRGIQVYDSSNNMTVTYLHLSFDGHVSEGQNVQPGDQIGVIGTSAQGCGVPHLHIDAVTGTSRPGCSRAGCSNPGAFIDIGPQLYETYQTLPD